MDERKIKDLIMQVILDLERPDITLLNVGNLKMTCIGRAMLDVSSDLKLKTDCILLNEEFIRPKKILYIYGVTAQEAVNLLISEDEKYRCIRECFGEISVLLEFEEIECLNGFNYIGDLYQSFEKLFNEIRVHVINGKSHAKNCQYQAGQKIIVEDTQDLRGKKILTLEDLLIKGPGTILVDSTAILTMALSDRLREKKIETRRV